jgi:hypothetical protein
MPCASAVIKLRRLHPAAASHTPLARWRKVGSVRGGVLHRRVTRTTCMTRDATLPPALIKTVMDSILTRVKSILDNMSIWLPLCSPMLLAWFLLCSGIVGDGADDIGDVLTFGFGAVMMMLLFAMGNYLSSIAISVLGGVPAREAMDHAEKDPPVSLSALLLCVALWGWLRHSSESHAKEWTVRTDSCIKDELNDLRGGITREVVLETVTTCRENNDPNDDEGPDYTDY